SIVNDSFRMSIYANLSTSAGGVEYLFFSIALNIVYNPSVEIPFLVERITDQMSMGIRSILSGCNRSQSIDDDLGFARSWTDLIVKRPAIINIERTAILETDLQTKLANS
ncbi:hypothetical protein PENTCL1PPCAC_19738, partial [Pristionchus entomophagus]